MEIVHVQVDIRAMLADRDWLLQSAASENDAQPISDANNHAIEHL